jgi:hypothetical protein
MESIHTCCMDAAIAAVRRPSVGPGRRTSAEPDRRSPLPRCPVDSGWTWVARGAAAVKDRSEFDADARALHFVAAWPWRGAGVTFDPSPKFLTRRDLGGPHRKSMEGIGFAMPQGRTAEEWSFPNLSDGTRERVMGNGRRSGSERRNQDRRQSIDRRQQVVEVAVERRSGLDRRMLLDRRTGLDRRVINDRRQSVRPPARESTRV